MYPPPGIRAFLGEVWEVLSSIYGAQQAGADWKKLWTALLIEFGFKAVN